MDDIQGLVSYVEGGEESLFGSLAEAICGDCKAPEDCEGCDGNDLITEMECQIARAGLDFMKRQVAEWLKYSVIQRK